VPIAYYTHLLTLPLLVVLLTVSASLAAWGDAGRFLVFTDSLPEEHHITANAVSTTAQELSTILGPLTAAVLIGWIGPAGTVGVDAATCAVLASIYRSAAPRTGRIQQPVAGGFAIIWRKPRLVGLMALTIGYYVLYGPVLVALPVLVSTDLHESVATLALCYSVFGFGSVAGIVVVPFLRAVPVWSVMIGSVLLFGLSLVPMGIGAPMGVALVAFAFGGLVWAPYVPVLTAVFQKEASPAVMAARGAFGMASTPLGTLVGGPVVAVLGARATLLGSGVATMALGVTAAIVVLAKRVRATNGVAAND
jgi:predicted MFS family arabinose efflux permease